MVVNLWQQNKNILPKGSRAATRNLWVLYFKPMSTFSDFISKNPESDEIILIAKGIQEEYGIRFTEAFDIAYKLYTYEYPTLTYEDIECLISDAINEIKKDIYEK